MSKDQDIDTKALAERMVQDRWVTLEEIHRILGISRDQVYRAAQAGKLQTRKVTAVRERDLTAFAERYVTSERGVPVVLRAPKEGQE